MAFIVFNYYYSFSGAASSVAAGVASSIVGGAAQQGLVQSAPHFFTFLLQEDFPPP